jgi:hypothetical protein
MMPLREQLGTDGKVMLRPGGMEYQAPAQKLQEVGVLGNVLAIAQNLPPGLQERFIRLGLVSYEVDDADGWMADMIAAFNAAAQQQEAMAAAGDPAAQGQGQGTPQGQPMPQQPQPSPAA